MDGWMKLHICQQHIVMWIKVKEDSLSICHCFRLGTLDFIQFLRNGVITSFLSFNVNYRTSFLNKSTTGEAFCPHCCTTVQITDRLLLMKNK